MERTKMPNLRNGSKGGFEPGLSRLRVRRSTTELPRSTMDGWGMGWRVGGWVTQHCRWSTKKIKGCLLHKPPSKVGLQGTATTYRSRLYDDIYESGRALHICACRNLNQKYIAPQSFLCSSMHTRLVVVSLNAAVSPTTGCWSPTIEQLPLLAGISPQAL